MITTISRTIEFGILGIAALFVIPFLLVKALISLLFLGVLLRLFGGRFGGGWRRRNDQFEHFDSYTVYTEKEGMNDSFQQNPKQV